MTSEMGYAIICGLLGFTVVGWLCIIANLTVVPLMKKPPGDLVWLGTWFALAVVVGVSVAIGMGAL